MSSISKMLSHLLYTMSLFFIFITIISIPNPPSVYAQNELYQNCNNITFQCGNFTNIFYPFWGSNRPEYCGHPNFRLNCSNRTAEIRIMNLTYQVLAINSSSENLKVARTDYVQNICPDILVNTTLDPNHFSFTSNTRNISLYYDCPNVSNQTNQFSCNINGNNSNGYYLTRNQGNVTSGLINSLGSCANNVIVPVTESAVQFLDNNSNVENLVNALNQGFELKWDANDTICEQCTLSGGICGQNRNSSVFACHCVDQSYPLTCGRGSGGKSNKAIKLGIGLGIAAAAILAICLGCYYCETRRGFWSGNVMALVSENTKQEKKIEAFIVNYHSHMPKRYSYSDIKKMTNSFSDKLGQGGFGAVYRGKLQDGRSMAVKVLSKSIGEGEEFINEVASISRTSHINIVTLLGFCYQRTKRALIYEYMPNGSLDKFIYDPGQQLERKMLYDIAIGIARGLEYLHRGCNTRIVHFDIKPQNVLLDKNFCPKISDFGLAKLCKERESIVSMLSARGTAGYIAPEVFMRNFGGASYKSDVYSYGMMILEMFGGQNNSDVRVSENSEMYFPDQIYKYLESGPKSILNESKEVEEETTRRMIIVGLWCIQTNPSDRPSMTNVVEMLESSPQSLPIPPKPLLFSATTQPEFSNTLSSSTTTNMLSQRDEENVWLSDKTER